VVGGNSRKVYDITKMCKSLAFPKLFDIRFTILNKLKGWDFSVRVHSAWGMEVAISVCGFVCEKLSKIC